MHVGCQIIFIYIWWTSEHRSPSYCDLMIKMAGAMKYHGLSVGTIIILSCVVRVQAEDRGRALPVVGLFAFKGQYPSGNSTHWAFSNAQNMTTASSNLLHGYYLDVYPGDSLVSLPNLQHALIILIFSFTLHGAISCIDNGLYISLCLMIWWGKPFVILHTDKHCEKGKSNYAIISCLSCMPCLPLETRAYLVVVSSTVSILWSYLYRMELWLQSWLVTFPEVYHTGSVRGYDHYQHCPKWSSHWEPFTLLTAILASLKSITYWYGLWLEETITAGYCYLW